MLTIGRIEYANCTPVFHALHELYPSNDYNYVGGVPAHLNSLLVSGIIDVCPSSSITFANHAEQCLIIPDISISGRGAVKSVLLFSTRPIEELDGDTVLLSSQSATSVNLLKILLKIRYGCECIYQPTNRTDLDMLREGGALLLIGDAALRATQALPRDVLVYDLGDIWCEWTGEPFVFALWLTTRMAAKSHGMELRRLSQRLSSAKVYAEEHLERIAEASPEKNWMGLKPLLDYWRQNISFDLSERHIAGLKRYFSLAAETGLIRETPELMFLEDYLELHSS